MLVIARFLIASMALIFLASCGKKEESVSRVEAVTSATTTSESVASASNTDSALTTNQKIQKISETLGPSGVSKCAAAFTYVAIIFIKDPSIPEEYKTKLRSYQLVLAENRKYLLANGVTEPQLDAQFRMWDAQLSAGGFNSYNAAFKECMDSIDKIVDM